MLEYVQERLVYRTHIYIQTDITGYKPAPGDLAYPDKLVMMEVGASYLIFPPPSHNFGYFILAKIAFFFLIFIQDAKARWTCHDIMRDNIKKHRTEIIHYIVLLSCLYLFIYLFIFGFLGPEVPRLGVELEL